MTNPTINRLSDLDRSKKFDELMKEALALGYRITDWVSCDMIQEHYELSEDQSFEVLEYIDLGDYDDMCINANSGSQDGRRDVLDNAVRDAGYLSDD
jgi:hypothetical protein